MKYLMKLSVLFILLSCNQSPNAEKTLVAWVSLTDTVEMEGSVITIQDGERFDGIYLSGEDGGKWIAGSENDKRTQPEKGIPVQESDGEDLIQLAIVYTDSEIRMAQSPLMAKCAQKRLPPPPQNKHLNLRNVQAEQKIPSRKVGPYYVALHSVLG